MAMDWLLGPAAVAKAHEWSHWPQPAKEALFAAAAAIEIPADQACLLILMALAIPVGFVMRLLKAPSARMLFALCFGLAELYMLIGTTRLGVLLVSTLGAYVLTWLQLDPKLVSIVAMVWLSLAQLRQIIHFYGAWEISFEQGLLLFTVKYITCAWDLADHRRAQQGLDLGGTDKIKAERARRGRPCPNIVEYFAFIFFFGGCISGPVFRIGDFLDYIRMEQDFARPASGSAAPLAQALMAAVGTFVLAGVACPKLVPMDYLLGTGTHAFLAVPFLEQPPWARFLYIWLAGILHRTKYFFAWYMAEASCITSGFALQVKGSETRYDRCNNGRFLLTEFATDPRDVYKNWNCGINDWLKHYVYERNQVSPIKAVFSNRTWATVVTRATSAMWHGFYPGYYMFFLSSVLLDQWAQVMGSCMKPRFDGRVYSLIMWALTSSGVNYLGSAFLLLDFKKGVDTWGSVYFIGHVFFPAVTFLVPILFPAPKKAKTT